jgi:hypothetical protein
VAQNHLGNPLPHLVEAHLHQASEVAHLHLALEAAHPLDLAVVVLGVLQIIGLKLEDRGLQLEVRGLQLEDRGLQVEDQDSQGDQQLDQGGHPEGCPGAHIPVLVHDHLGPLRVVPKGVPKEATMEAYGGRIEAQLTAQVTAGKTPTTLLFNFWIA